MTALDSTWGPPNHAAHSAGRVLRDNEPLREPTPPKTQKRPTLTPQPQDRLQGYLKAYGRALGDGWAVCAWEEPQQWRIGIRGRHSCGFAMEAHVEHDLMRDPISVVQQLGTALLAKERRHSCEAFDAEAL